MRPVTTTGVAFASPRKASSLSRPVSTISPSTRRERSTSMQRASSSAFQWPLTNKGL